MPTPPLAITVLGSGTSVGVPTPGCDCAVCRSTDPRDNRLRPSVLLSVQGREVLIDTTPDFRTQALRARLGRLDAVLFTHAHADHLMGLDDIRPFNFKLRHPIPIYAAPEAMETIQRSFQYIFDGVKKETNIPLLTPHILTGALVDVCGVRFTPIPLLHGRARIYGFRFGDAAYLTDHSAIPEESLEMLRGLDVLFLDALRYKPHPTHSTIAQSLETVARLAPRRAYFTHLSHDVMHATAERELPPHIRLAWDGLRIEVEAAG
jgi:phosphoribosyl 1,2-cyclic phosphate phosphodiesterase